MIRVGLPPTIDSLNAQTTNQWFRTTTDRLNVYSGASDPTTAEVPEGQWIVYNNTTVPEVRIWTNIAGVMKKSAAFT